MMAAWYAIDWQGLFGGPWHAMAVVGGVLLVAALWALFAERRRTRRNDLDRVGCMPWTMIYVLCFFLACVLLGGALRSALGS